MVSSDASYPMLKQNRRRGRVRRRQLRANRAGSEGAENGAVRVDCLSLRLPAVAPAAAATGRNPAKPAEAADPFPIDLPRVAGLLRL